METAFTQIAAIPALLALLAITPIIAFYLHVREEFSVEALIASTEIEPELEPDREYGRAILSMPADLLNTLLPHLNRPCTTKPITAPMMNSSQIRKGLADLDRHLMPISEITDAIGDLDSGLSSTAILPKEYYTPPCIVDDDLSDMAERYATLWNTEVFHIDANCALVDLPDPHWYMKLYVDYKGSIHATPCYL